MTNLRHQTSLRGLLHRVSVALVLLLATCVPWVTPLSGRAAAQAASKLEAADLAWERGDYPAALAAYLRLLDPTETPDALEPIALRTGELFETVELTREGAAPQFSAGGHLLYEHGPLARRVTRLATIADPTKTLAELRGTGASFSPDGTKVAYWKSTAPAQAGDAAAPTTAPPPQAAFYNVRSGEEIILDTGSAAGTALYAGANDTLIFAAPSVPKGPAQLHAVGPSRPVAALTSDATDKVIASINATGTALVFTTRAPGAGRGGRGAAPAAAGGRGTGTPPAPPAFNVLTIADGKIATIEGSAPAFSADGSMIVFVRRSADESSVLTIPTADPSSAPAVVRKGPERVDAPALSPTATHVAFQMMTRDDWELVVVKRDGTEPQRLTRDIQHDVLPQFLNDRSVLGVIGEARHRRSFLYDLDTGSRTRLFHNNTVRTIAPEYSWKISPDGTKLLIVAERDGDTVSVERGVYLMDLTRRVTRESVRQRVADNLAAEEALRAKAQRMYAPFAESVKAMVSEASVDRVYSYEKALFDFDSKHISQPGNLKASAYLFNTYKSFGYEPEYQWFDRANALGGRTANVLATLKGTVNPELIYVVSSHYDSVAIGPGADDDSSGTAALLETARIMATRPQPATIIFASFTGEEAGLLGSREFVRSAVADKRQVVGALNNDMVGWANDQRLDNTIRYSNPGIRDIQHAAALQFTKLITYDALYYRSTDAAAYYEAYGDIVGGIGSYPVLSSPHYHQSHDVLENMNHQLITEVAKTTAATLVMLASSPSRLTGLTAERDATGAVAVSWKPSPETGVNAYLVTYGPPEKPTAQQMRVKDSRVTIRNAAPGTVVAVKAVTGKGVEGWDWARVTVKETTQ